MPHQQCRHAGLIRADSNSIASDAGLRHFEQRAPNPISVADANLIVRQTFNGKVLAELAPGKIVAPKLLFPISIRVDLIDEHRAMLAPMPGQVSLPVTVEIEPPHRTRTQDWALPYCSVHRLSFPRNIAWKADIHRHQTRHDVTFRANQC
jgi:hypothetical protein